MIEGYHVGYKLDEEQIMVKKRGKMQSIHLDHVKLGGWLNSDTVCNFASNAHMTQNVILTLCFLQKQICCCTLVLYSVGDRVTKKVLRKNPMVYLTFSRRKEQRGENISYDVIYE